MSEHFFENVPATQHSSYPPHRRRSCSPTLLNWRATSAHHRFVSWRAFVRPPSSIGLGHIALFLSIYTESFSQTIPLANIADIERAKLAAPDRVTLTSTIEGNVLDKCSRTGFIHPPGGLSGFTKPFERIGPAPIRSTNMQATTTIRHKRLRFAQHQVPAIEVSNNVDVHGDEQNEQQQSLLIQHDNRMSLQSGNVPRKRNHRPNGTLQRVAWNLGNEVLHTNSEPISSAVPTSAPSTLRISFDDEETRSQQSINPWLSTIEQWGAPGQSPYQQTVHTADEEHHPTNTTPETPPTLPPSIANLEALWTPQFQSSPELHMSSIADLPGRSVEPRHYDVFLGGSCGRTSWRQDIVIPKLQQYGISYFNPQVDIWAPHLIEVEERAKQNSAVLLFVIDPTTVNAASFIEIPYMLARGASMVVVFTDENEWVNNGHKCDKRDRDRLMDFIYTVIAYHQVPFFRSVEAGLDHLVEDIVGRMPLSKFTNMYNVTRLLYVKTQLARMRIGVTRMWSRATMQKVTERACECLTIVAERVISTASNFTNSTRYSVEIAVAGVLSSLYPQVSVPFILVALVLVHISLANLIDENSVDRSASRPMLERRRTHDGSSRTNLSHDMNNNGLVERSKSMATLSAYRHTKYLSRDQSLLGSNTRLSQDGIRTRRPTMPTCLGRPVHSVSLTTRYDVFVGGSGTAPDLDWLTRTARPILTAHQITYFDTTQCRDFAQRAFALEKTSRIIYHTSSPLSALSALSELAYLMGAYGSSVIGSVPPWCINVNVCECFCAATERTIRVRNRCYQRAFEYVRDIAVRNNCRLFKRAEDAFRFVVTDLQSTKRNRALTLHASTVCLHDDTETTTPCAEPNSSPEEKSTKQEEKRPLLADMLVQSISEPSNLS